MQPANRGTASTDLSTPTTATLNKSTSHSMQPRSSAPQKIPGLTAGDVASYSLVPPNKKGVTSLFKSILNLFTAKSTSPPPKSPPSGVVNASVTKLSPSAPLLLPPSPPSPPTFDTDLTLQSVICNQPQSASSTAPQSPSLAPAASQPAYNPATVWNWDLMHNQTYDYSSVTSSNSSLDLEMANSLIPSSFSGLSTEDAAEFISDVGNWFDFRKLSSIAPSNRGELAFLYCSENLLSTGA